jgi:hypothetical protein
MFSSKPNTLAGFEPGYSIPEADAMSTAPRWLRHFKNILKSQTFFLGNDRLLSRLTWFLYKREIAVIVAVGSQLGARI